MLTYKGENVLGETFAMENVANEHGLCCKISLKDVKRMNARAGKNQGLQLLVDPGLSDEEGIYVALHHYQDVPLMDVKGRYLAKVFPKVEIS